jgi:hypothetical protein
MYKETEYRAFLNERGMRPEKIEHYVDAVRQAWSYFDFNGKRLTDCNVTDFKEYVTHLVDIGQNSYDNLMPLGRYVYMLDMKEQWIYYAAILGGEPIMPSIRERLTELAGKHVCDTIFSQVEEPPLGSDPDKYPKATKQLMDQLQKELPQEIYRRVLAGNHHRVPVEHFIKLRDRLKELDGDIDSWLKEMHAVAVSNLEEHLRENKVWYEQVITQDIVDLVKSNQELLAGVRKGDWIYNQKFPYAPQDWIEAEDPVMKRYYMCHCPMARESLLTDEPDIPMEWCYCSAGYGKLRYDIAFGAETEAEVLESVFSGSDTCRFRFKIPEKWR